MSPTGRHFWKVADIEIFLSCSKAIRVGLSVVIPSKPVVSERWLWSAIVICVLFLASTVSAHATLVKSFPARRAVLYRAPARVDLWFNERLEPRFSSVSVSNSNGKRVDLGTSEV